MFTLIALSASSVASTVGLLVIAALVMFLALAFVGLRWMKRDKARLRHIPAARLRKMTLGEVLLHAAAFDDEDATKWLESIGIICKTVSVNVASMAAGASGVGTVAVTGLTPAHRCIVQSQAALSVAIALVGAACATAGTLTVHATNPSAGVLDAAAVNMTLIAIPGDLN